MDDGHARDTGRLAMVVGVVAAGSAVSLATYFAVGGPFGTLNDIGNAATGVLSAALAWRLRRHLSGRPGSVVAVAAILGGAITVAGSALVVSGTTSFFLAGLVSSVGFAGIGTWLVVVNGSRDPMPAWPSRLRRLGVLSGALMAAGILAVPGILVRFDDAETAPGWAWIGFVGWLGIYVAYPAWAIWMGTLEARRARLHVGEAIGPNETGDARRLSSET